MAFSPVKLLLSRLLQRRVGSVVRLLARILRRVHDWIAPLLVVRLRAQVLRRARDSLWVVPLLVVYYAAPRSRGRCLRSVVVRPVALAIQRLSRRLRYALLHSRRLHALLLHTGQQSSPAISRVTDVLPLTAFLSIPCTSRGMSCTSRGVS
jgi:hypothetical protein